MVLVDFAFLGDILDIFCELLHDDDIISDPTDRPRFLLTDFYLSIPVKINNNRFETIQYPYIIDNNSPPSIPSREIVIPLSFNFTKHPSLSIMLARLQNRKDVYIELEIEDIENLYQVNPIDVSIAEDLTDLTEGVDDEILNEAEDTLTIINKVIDDMNEIRDTNILKSIIKELYLEALNVE